MDNGILLSIIAGSFGTGGLIIRYLFYSKCTTVKCCGCVVTRDIVHEEHHPDQTNSNNNNNVV